MKKYIGCRLCGVPTEDMKGLKVVDNFNDVGIVTEALVVRAPEPDNPTCVIYVTIDWVKKGRRVQYHWMNGWVKVINPLATVEEIENCKTEIAAEYNAMLQTHRESLKLSSTPVKQPKGWFAKLRDLLGV